MKTSIRLSILLLAGVLTGSVHAAPFAHRLITQRETSNHVTVVQSAPIIAPSVVAAVDAALLNSPKLLESSKTIQVDVATMTTWYWSCAGYADMFWRLGMFARARGDKDTQSSMYQAYRRFQGKSDAIAALLSFYGAPLANPVKWDEDNIKP